MKKAGLITCSLILIILGVLELLIQLNLVFLATGEMVKYIIPVFLIMLGAELLYWSNKTEHVSINYGIIIITAIIVFIVLSMNSFSITENAKCFIENTTRE